MTKALKIILILFIATSLISSVILSLNSFTGYIIAEKIEGSTNISALTLFLAGLFGALVYLVKFR